MKNRPKILIAILALTVLSLGGWFGLAKKHDTQTSVNIFPSDRRLLANTAAVKNIANGELKTYLHPELGFSFNYPADFKIGIVGEASQEQTLLVQKDEVGFQLIISPFAEDIILTEERLRRDIPDLIINEPLAIQIGEAIGLAFLTGSDSLGQTREIWWVHEGSLYQITTYTEFDEAMVKILESWQFE